MKKLLSFLLAASVLLAPSLANAITIPNAPALVDTYLVSAITSSQTSMTLASGVTRDGTTLSGYTCFVLDVNQTNVEFACGTASGTAVTGLTRGVSLNNPAATSTSYSHRRLATVQIVEYPLIQIVSLLLRGSLGLPNVLQYDSSITTSSVLASGLNLVSVAALADATSTGCVNASETARGCSELATTAELAAGTSSGGTGARLVAPGSAFGATSAASVMIPVTGAGGKLSTGFIDQTANYTWSGTTTFSGVVSSTGPIVNVYSASTTWTKPANLKYVIVELVGGGGAGGGCSSASGKSFGGGGGGGGYSRKLIQASALSATTSVVVGAATATSSFGSFLQATGGSNGAFEALGGVGGIGSLGDLNSPGAQGGIGDGDSSTGIGSGFGGNSRMGLGGGQVSGGNTSGKDGGAYGAGGSGQSCTSGGSSGAGGNGSTGVVTVTEYYI